MLPHITKNDLYAQLISVGIKKGYIVIPEFRVHLSDVKRKKNIDLVWAVRKPGVATFQNCQSPDYWTLHATFEIEACDVRNTPCKEFSRHIIDLPNIKNTNPAVPIRHFIVLYTSAYDRNWNHKRNVKDDISLRSEWAKGTDITVLDGRDLAIVENLTNAIIA